MFAKQGSHCGFIWLIRLQFQEHGPARPGNIIQLSEQLSDLCIIAPINDRAARYIAN